MADETKKNDKPEKEAAAPAPAPEEGKKAEAPAKDEKPKATAGTNPWIPVLVVIIVLPILSLVVTDMIIVPKIKKAAEEIVKIQEAAGHPAEGGVMPGGHAETKSAAKEKPKASGGHGGGGHGEAAGPSNKDAIFENIVANLSGSMKSRFLKISFTLESNDPEFNDVIKENRTQIIDATIGIISSLTLAELEEPGMKNIVRNDLIDAFNQVLKRPLVNRLFFSEFVIQ